MGNFVLTPPGFVLVSKAGFLLQPLRVRTIKTKLVVTIAARIRIIIIPWLLMEGIAVSAIPCQARDCIRYYEGYLYATVMAAASVRKGGLEIFIAKGNVVMHLTRQTVLVLLLLVFCCGVAVAQRAGPQFRRPLACEPVEPRTKLEGIESQYERVLIKGFSQIATLNARGADVRIDAVELKDTATGTRATGIVIAMRETAENPHENRAFVDYEEVDGLLKALEAVGRVSETVTKLASFESRYRTVGDFEIIVFRQSRSGTAASVTSGICDRVTGLLTLDELDRLRAHITEAKTRLDEIK